MRKPDIKYCHTVKLNRLLDMMYRPAELADEIGVNVDTIHRSYIPAGLPHVRDESTGAIWIHGPAFAAWARATVANKSRKRNPLPDGYGWCLRCNQPVEMRDITIRKTNRYLELEQAKCPRCGGTVNRARRRS